LVLNLGFVLLSPSVIESSTKDEMSSMIIFSLGIGYIGLRLGDDPRGTIRDIAYALSGVEYYPIF
jgi:hypothetical protein